MNREPLPCPFCGHVGLDFAEGSTYRWGVASCGGCGASCGEMRREYPDKGGWHDEAIAEWNRRTTPPQHTWVGLTQDEQDKVFKTFSKSDAYKRDFLNRIASAIEAKLKSKNNADH